MGRVWQLLVRADGDTKAAQKEMRALQRSTKKFGQNVGGMGKSLSMAVTAPIIALGTLGVSELRQTMAVTKKTDAVFESMGSTMKVTKGQLSKLVTELEGYSAVEGDIIQNAANVGLTFSQLAGNPELFKKTTRAAVDMSAALGQDMQTTMTQLGKAMQSGAKGAAALGKNGTLAKDDIAKLQAMAKAGAPMWKQQEFILKAVNKQYAGQGKNVDPIKAITIAVKNVAETLAVLLLPAITKVSQWLQKLAAWVSGLSAEQKKWLGVILLVTAVIGPLLMVIGSMIVAFSAILPVLAAVSLPMLAIVAAVIAVIAVGVLLYKNWDTVKSKLSAAWDAIKSKASAVWGWIKDFISRHAVLIATVVMAPIGGLVVWMIKNWAAIKSGISSAWTGIRDTAERWATSTATYVGNAIDNAIAKVRAVWTNIKTGVADAWGDIRDTAQRWATSVATTIENAIDGLPAKLKSIGAAAGSALANAIKSAVNAVIGKWNGLEIPAFKVTVMGKSVGIPSVSLPDLPMFARGGITNQPSIFGEDGLEAAVPLGRSARATADRNRVLGDINRMGMGAAGSGVVIQVMPSSGDPEAIARRVVQILGSRHVAMGGTI